MPLKNTHTSVAVIFNPFIVTLTTHSLYWQPLTYNTSTYWWKPIITINLHARPHQRAQPIICNHQDNDGSMRLHRILSENELHAEPYHV